MARRPPPDEPPAPTTATSSEANEKRESGSSIVTSHLDLDDLPDPDEADRLHDDRADEHHLAHVLVEKQRSCVGVDERQRDGEGGRQRHQHVAGEAAVRRVHAHLAEDLEPLAHDVREVVENLRRGCRRFPAGSARR